jgi:hypothetical protein
VVWGTLPGGGDIGTLGKTRVCQVHDRPIGHSFTGVGKTGVRKVWKHGVLRMAWGRVYRGKIGVGHEKLCVP